MPASVHVVARFVAKEGKEEALKNVLIAFVAPTRRELGCYQYDLLQSPTDPREFCFVERWESEKALAQHAASEHLRQGREAAAELIDGPAEARRYNIV